MACPIKTMEKCQSHKLGAGGASATHRNIYSNRQMDLDPNPPFFCKYSLNQMGREYSQSQSQSSRNCFVFEGKMEDPLFSATRAEAVVESYRRIKSGKNIALAGQQVWKPPPPGLFKVNVDAATNLSKQRGGIGAVVRDSRGDCVAAAAQRITLKGNVADMEAEAVLLGIQVARKANCAHFVIESDSKEVLELVLKRKSSLAEISWNIEEIQECLKGQNTTSILFVPRRCNVMAHNLAKVALDRVDPVLWIGNCPIPAVDVILQF